MRSCEENRYRQTDLLPVVVLRGLEQLWNQAAPALLHQLLLQGHLGVLTLPFFMGRVLDWVRSGLEDQHLKENMGPHQNPRISQKDGTKSAPGSTFSVIMSYNMVTIRVLRIPPTSALKSSDRIVRPPWDRK